MRRIASVIVLTIAAFGQARQTPAQTASPDRIEEDWKLIIATPDVAGVGPQITTSMSPVADRTQAPFVALDLNYREYPSFSPGGLQAQVWSDDKLGQYATGTATDQFATANETITWSQRMSVAGGTMTYQLLSGSSTTWGTFGGDVQVTFATSLATLSGYSSATSVANSGVSWQVNNVQELTLVAVRYYSGSTLLSTDSTARKLVLNGAVVKQGATCALRSPSAVPRLNALAARWNARDSSLAILGPGRPRKPGSLLRSKGV